MVRFSASTVRRRATEAAYLTADYEEMEQLSATVLKNAKDILDKTKVYEVGIQAAIAQYRMLDAVTACSQRSANAGAAHSGKPRQIGYSPRAAENQMASDREKHRIIGRSSGNDRFEESRDCADHIRRGKGHIRGLSALTPLLIAKTVHLSVKHGNAPESALSYASYGLILCGYVGDLDSGYRFGRLAMKLLERFASGKLRVNTIMVVHFFVKPWKEHYADQLEALRDAFRTGMESGSLEEAAHSAYMYCSGLFRIGKALPELEKEMATTVMPYAR